MWNCLVGDLRRSGGHAFEAETSSLCMKRGGSGTAGNCWWWWRAEKEFQKLLLMRMHGTVYAVYVSRS